MLTDKDKMPFCKYKDTLMEDVPAEYLNWLWTNGASEDNKPVSQYIRENLNALKKEYPEGDWDE